ncbi:hypothetical protein CDV55_100755 [Aspergillus turcosus]|uniref:Short-chain dehydrogenase n=1 Tax=Aspergillus turcosus TaxID=1245748 RepID=A0A229YZ45_9EURO|nr:hypothetical protein CDV55_100755 [Aspergillus turcosus]RLL94245.1 hypothetical protein CFD26_100826 [Aspergillus turcosus]
MGALISSPTPPPTERNLGDQTGKVFIVTGATSGYGLRLVRILYQHNGKVYLAARNAGKAQQVIEDMKRDFPESRGQLHFLHLNLSDLSTIKGSAEEFLSKESQLHVLWNNAGVMVPPQGSKTQQGYELQLGTNNLGPFLLTKLLYPALAKTAAVSPANTVRVVWVSSSAVSIAPKPAVDFSNMDYHRDEGAWTKYARSKAGNVLQAAELARRSRKDGVVSVTLDPGVAATELQRTMPWWMSALVKLLGQKPEIGAYTQLYAGLQPDLDCHKADTWIVPPGKLAPGRKDLFDADLGRKYWEWNEEQISPYM